MMGESVFKVNVHAILKSLEILYMSQVKNEIYYRVIDVEPYEFAYLIKMTVYLE